MGAPRAVQRGFQPPPPPPVSHRPFGRPEWCFHPGRPNNCLARPLPTPGGPAGWHGLDLVQLVKARPLRATGAELVVGKEGLTLVGEEAEVAAAGRLLAVARREAVIPAGRAVGCWLQDGGQAPFPGRKPPPPPGGSGQWRRGACSTPPQAGWHCATPPGADGGCLLRAALRNRRRLLGRGGGYKEAWWGGPGGPHRAPHSDADLVAGGVPPSSAMKPPQPAVAVF